VFKTFDEIIKSLDIGTHSTSYRLESGRFYVEEVYMPQFKALYRPAGVSKSVGNGEVALYWLLNKDFGGQYEVNLSSGQDQADFVVDTHKVEIKGWANSILNNHRIKVGRFESFHELRRLLNVIFGAYNVFYAGHYSDDKHGPLSYLSEVSFGINGLTRAFDCAIKIKDIPLKHLDNVRDTLAHPMFNGLVYPRDFAAEYLATLAATKLKTKIGSGNYIMNALPGKHIGVVDTLRLGEISVTECDMEKIKNDGVKIRCSELFINLQAFEKKI